MTTTVLRDPRGRRRAHGTAAPGGSFLSVSTLCRRFATLGVAALAPAAFALPARAQSVPIGFQDTVTPVSSSDQLYHTLASGPFAGDMLRFNGSQLIRNTGGMDTVLLTIPGTGPGGSTVFSSFLIQRDDNSVLFGESSSNDIWLVPLQPSATNPPGVLVNVFFNYDAVLWDQNTMLVSAKTDNFSGPDNDILAVDLTTGATDLIAAVPGASGPIALTPDGELLYVTSSLAFPAPPNSSDILRFSRNQILGAFGPSELSLSDAEILVGGVAGGSSMVVDAQGDIIVTIPGINDVVEFPRLGSEPARTLLQSGSLFPSGIQLFGNDGFFSPFQRAESATIQIFETDFFSTAQVRQITGTDPTLTIPGQTLPNGTLAVLPGPTTVSITQGPANGFAQLWIGLGGAGVETRLPGNLLGLTLEAPVLAAPGVLTPFSVLPVVLDAAGAGSVTVTNPGGWTVPPTLTLQALVAAPGSAPLILTTTAPQEVVAAP